MDKQELKRWAISSAVTFASGFIITIAGVVNEINPETITMAAVAGIVLAGVRGGVKALAEFVLRQTERK